MSHACIFAEADVKRIGYFFLMIVLLSITAKETVLLPTTALADPEIPDTGIVVTTPCVALEVSNTQSWGRENEHGGLWRYMATDEDSLINPLYDGSLVISDVNVAGSSYRDIFTNVTPYNPGYRAVDIPTLSYDAATNDSVVSIFQETIDSAWGIYVNYFFPQEPENCEIVHLVFRTYARKWIQSELIIGAALDFNVDPTGNNDIGGYVDNYNLVYQHGTDPDTLTYLPDTVQVTNRYAAGITALTCDPIRRMAVQSNRVYVDGSGGFTDEYVQAQMDSVGRTVWVDYGGTDTEDDYADDLHSIIAIDNVPPKIGVYENKVYQLALVSSMNAAEGVRADAYPAGATEMYVSDLIASTGKAWKKGFGWNSDFWLISHSLAIELDGEIRFRATGTHEDGINGGCCGCVFSYQIVPIPTEGTVVLNTSGCEAALEFHEVLCETFVVTLTVEDLCSEQSDQIIFAVGAACVDNCGQPFGDLDCSGSINPVDVVYLVNFVYKDQDARCYPYPWVCPVSLGDVDCSHGINPVDVVYYVNKVYKNLDAFCNPLP